jgi:hypothetical protein
VGRARPAQEGFSKNEIEKNKQLDFQKMKLKIK